jgi:hypothetical protein
MSFEYEWFAYTIRNPTNENADQWESAPFTERGTENTDIIDSDLSSIFSEEEPESSPNLETASNSSLEYVLAELDSVPSTITIRQLDSKGQISKRKQLTKWMQNLQRFGSCDIANLSERLDSPIRVFNSVATMLEHDMFKVKTCRMNELGKTLRKKIVSCIGNVLAIKVLIALTFYGAYAPVHS